MTRAQLIAAVDAMQAAAVCAGLMFRDGELSAAGEELAKVVRRGDAVRASLERASRASR